MASPLFYDNVVVLDKQKHKNLQLTAERSLSFAKAANSIPVAGFEFFDASRSYPVFFIKNAEGEFIPLVILSFLKDGHELGEDVWRDVYIPTYVRRYPFMISTDGVVVIDDASNQLVKEGGIPLFKEDGEPSDEFNQHLEFLDVVDKGFKRTGDFCKAVADKDLFRLFDSKLNFPQGTVNLGDVYIIDEKKLHKDLDQAEVHEWFNNGWIGWVHAHLHSLSSVQQVMKRAVDAQAEKKDKADKA